MATFEWERIESEPIVLCTMHHDFKVVSDTDSVAHDFEQLMGNHDETVYAIFDATEVLPDLKDAIEGAAVAALGQETFLHHPQIKASYFVSKNKLLRLAVQGLNSAAYGFVPVSLFDTVEDALCAARQRVSEE